MQVWCCDGPSPAELHDGQAARWLHGAAWNTPATREEIHRARHRHLTGCSRGVGIRLVRNPASKKVPAAELAALLTGWITSLGCRTRSLAALDQAVIEALGSQADVGLGSHVGAGAGESGQGQPPELLGETQARQVGELHELHAPDRPRVSALGGSSVTWPGEAPPTPIATSQPKPPPRRQLPRFEGSPSGFCLSPDQRPGLAGRCAG